MADKEVADELKKYSGSSGNKELFPEHSFYATCFKLGMSMQDLQFFSYIDIIKIFLSFIKDKKENKKETAREATQADIDKFLR